MKRFILFLLCVFLSICRLPYAAIYYVTQSGAGDGSGMSLDNAMSLANHNGHTFTSGDVVKICDDINGTLIVPSDGVSYTGFCDEINGTINTAEANGIRIIGRSNIKIEHLDIQAHNDGISIYGGARSINIDSCVIHDTLYKGIVVTDLEGGDNPSIDITITNNTIYDCGAGTAGGDIVLAHVDNFLIRHNHLFATKSDGLVTDRGIDGIALEYASNGIIEYNNIHDHNDNYYDDPLGEGYYPRIGRGEDGIDVKALSHNITIRFNHIYNQKFQTGITVQSGSHDIDIYSNYLHNNLWCGILLKDSNPNSPLCNDNNATKNILIYSNIISENLKRGISTESGCDGVETCTIANNMISENASQAEGSAECAIYVAGINGTTITNNIFYENETAYGTRHHIFASNQATNTTIINNLFFVSDGESKLYIGGDLVDINHPPATNNMDTDPIIKKYTPAGYFIASASPIFGKGRILQIPNIGIIAEKTNWQSLYVTIKNKSKVWDIGPFARPEVKANSSRIVVIKK